MKLPRPLHDTELPTVAYRGPRRRELTDYERAMNEAMFGDRPPGYFEQAERLRAQHAEANAEYMDLLEKRKSPSRRKSRRRA